MKRLVFLLILLLFTFSLTLAQDEESFTYSDKGRRDPFLPLVDENGRFLLAEEILYSSDELSLSGILWDPQGKSSALINNQMVKIGETISGFKIRKITKNSVVILRDGKEYILRLSIEEKEQEQ